MSGSAALEPLVTTRPTPLRRRLLAGLHRSLEWCGATRAFVRLADVKGATILMLHSVPDAQAAPWIDPSNALPPAVFERHMEFLAERRSVISLSTLADLLAAGETPPPGTVVLTFDDGYRDNLEIAAPVLTRLDLPATLYLPTGYITREENQWIDRLYAAFRARTRDELVLPGEGHRWDLGGDGVATAAYRTLCGELLATTLDERRALLDEILAQLAPGASPPRLMLTWDEVRRLRDEHPGFEFGGHTVDHLDLRTQPQETAQTEIARCREDIERELGVSPRHFSFPYGRSTPGARQSAAEAGWRTAVAAAEPALIAAGIDPHALPRVEAPHSSTLLAFVTGGAYPDLSLRLTGRT